MWSYGVNVLLTVLGFLPLSLILVLTIPYLIIRERKRERGNLSHYG
jgi:hypothetical protein